MTDPVAQMALLVEEARNLRPLLAEREEIRLSDQPLGKWSIKQILGHLADCDRQVFLPRIRALREADGLVFDRVDQDGMDERSGWNDKIVQEVLDALQEARTRLLEEFEGVSGPVWDHRATFGRDDVRTVREYAEHIARHDAHHLAQIAERIRVGA